MSELESEILNRLRKINLNGLVDACKKFTGRNQAEFASTLTNVKKRNKMDASYLSQLKSNQPGNRPITLDTARQIEIDLHLPKGFMDIPELTESHFKKAVESPETLFDDPIFSGSAYKTYQVTERGQNEIADSAGEQALYYNQIPLDEAKLAWILKIMDRVLARSLGDPSKAAYDTRASVFAVAWREVNRDHQITQLKTETAVRLVESQIEEKANG